MAEDAAGVPFSGRRVLLAVTGGIAAYKSAFLARLLVEAGALVQTVMTPSATRFVSADTFAALTGRPVHSDVFERPETVLHVRLAHEADIAVVAPATANVLAKLAAGLADDLLTSTILEASCPLILAPAMHWGMWNHLATQANVRTLAGRGALFVGPETGALAAGDEGVGRMAEPEEILAAVGDALAGAPRGSSPLAADPVACGGPEPRRHDLVGKRILVTAGPTYEPIDAVRFLGNRSSGKMGFEIATQARWRGAAVTLVTGPAALPDPVAVEVIRVETAAEMAGHVLDRYPGVDAVVMAAAVADYRPSNPVQGKLKKGAGPQSIRLERTIDILAELGKRKERQVLVGFAAETSSVESEGRRKLTEKNLDLIVVNEVGKPGTGFGSDTSRAALLAAAGGDVGLRVWTKAELAAVICDRLGAALT